MNKATRALYDMAKKYGAKLEKTRNGHWKFLCPDGSIVVAAKSPSDHRAQKNLESRLRRGAEV